MRPLLVDYDLEHVPTVGHFVTSSYVFDAPLPTHLLVTFYPTEQHGSHLWSVLEDTSWTAEETSTILKARALLDYLENNAYHAIPATREQLTYLHELAARLPSEHSLRAKIPQLWPLRANA